MLQKAIIIFLSQGSVHVQKSVVPVIKIFLGF